MIELRDLKTATEAYIAQKLVEAKKEQENSDKEIKESKSLGQPLYKDHWMKLYRIKSQISGAKAVLEMIEALHD